MGIMKNSEENIIHAKGLSKAFGDVQAVDQIDFTVKKQSCFGFLGPNGAGKTTTIRMISCFLEPSDGVLEVLGKNVKESPRYIKERIGICPQEDNLDPDLTVENNLRVFARYFDIVGKEANLRSEELLHFMGLFSKRKATIEELSGGMKRRLIIARSLLNRPKLLVLDEPTTGLDPQSRHQIWEKLQQLKNEGTTILLTTHYMEEAARLCDQLVIMDQGKIVVEGEPKALIEQHIGSSIVEIESDQEDVEIYLKAHGLEFERNPTHFFIYGRAIMSLWPEISQKFGEKFCVLRMATLEDVFLKLTGRALRES
ncbi:MAG: ATP-binding cassette domain-containing protein [Candidatus Omnitrophica bacterium]|nr:ATP-binding cassette domain-containing protein [Candidatus Omnitrophota bacterium]